MDGFQRRVRNEHVFDDVAPERISCLGFQKLDLCILYLAWEMLGCGVKGIYR